MRSFKIISNEEKSLLNIYLNICIKFTKSMVILGHSSDTYTR